MSLIIGTNLTLVLFSFSSTVTSHFTLCIIVLVLCSEFHLSTSCRYYSATILQMSGVEDEKLAIWLSSLTAFTNFLFTLLGVWMVEKVGRRKLTLGSIVGEYTQQVSPLFLFCWWLRDYAVVKNMGYCQATVETEVSL